MVELGQAALAMAVAIVLGLIGAFWAMVALAASGTLG